MPNARVAIVMPAYNAARLLPQTVPAALQAEPAQLVVVDPGSDDGTADVAESLGAAVIRLGRRAGPAEARNAGVTHVDADVILFVDSDCVAHPDVVRRVEEAFANDPGLASLTGSYDDAPPDPGFFSQYMNLRHHHTHQRARTDDATFWAGCGAVRSTAFAAAGGFDAALYPRPMIEDIELGLRLKAHGATRLDPDLQVTHLKRWTLASVVTTDIFHRAVPWTRLILERQGVPNDLNLRLSQRIAALVAPWALLSFVVAPILLWSRPAWALLPMGLLAVALVLNLDLVRFFARRGLAFACGAFLFHQIHLFYSAAVFALTTLHHRIGRRRSSPA